MCIWEREEMQDTMFELLSQLFPYITCSGMHGHESAFTAPVAVIWHLAWDLSSVIVSVLPERGSVKINMGGGDRSQFFWQTSASMSQSGSTEGRA